MTKTRVSFPGQTDADARGLTIRVNTDAPNFEIKIEKLEASFLHHLNDRWSDLIDIASAIFAADSRVSRGGSTRRDFGEHWRRKMHFRFEVRDPAFWAQPEISEALRHAVHVMSDDDVDFEFVQSNEILGGQRLFEYGLNSPVFAAEDVVMFSGGLDSLAGAYDYLSSRDGKLILLTYSSANKTMKYPRMLVSSLKERFPNRIFWLSVSGHLTDVAARETTQRTRSLLFACLGFVTAQLSGAKRLTFYENGIVSANLPISAQVIGTMASRTTHPRTIAALSALFEALDPGKVSIANPYNGFTKSQVASRLAELGGADLIRHTISCSHVREQIIATPHCGSCSQCLDRRFGILAAGLGSHDPAEGYATQVLTGERSTEASRVLALDWTRHAIRLTQMSDQQFFQHYGLEFSRLLQARPDLSSSELARSILAMHRHHGEGVIRAISQAVSDNSDAILKQTLPETSLLRNIVAELAAIPSAVMPPDFLAEIPISDMTESFSPFKVRIAGSGASASVAIEGLGEVFGANATPAWALRKCHELDELDNRQRFIPGGDLAQLLTISKTTFRKRVNRFRQKFAEYYEAVEGSPPAQPILIQSEHGRNYRLDPDCELLGESHTKLDQA
jgi:hypothetical protein